MLRHLIFLVILALCVDRFFAQTVDNAKPTISEGVTPSKAKRAGEQDDLNTAATFYSPGYYRGWGRPGYYGGGLVRPAFYGGIWVKPIYGYGWGRPGYGGYGGWHRPYGGYPIGYGR